MSKGLVIINTQDQGGRKYTFLQKFIAHPNFPSNFYTPSENVSKNSYPNMITYVLIIFYDI